MVLLYPNIIKKRFISFLFPNIIENLINNYHFIALEIYTKIFYSSFLHEKAYMSFSFNPTPNSITTDFFSDACVSMYGWNTQ